MWDWLTGKKWIEAALDDHEDETGESYELIKAGIPPIRLWLRNRKGDKWGLVADEEGNECWVRFRQRIFTKGPPLTFFD